jgi:hypothetical protein
VWVNAQVFGFLAVRRYRKAQVVITRVQSVGRRIKQRNQYRREKIAAVKCVCMRAQRTAAVD